jgi:hypothetical protein
VTQRRPWIFDEANRPRFLLGHLALWYYEGMRLPACFAVVIMLLAAAPQTTFTVTTPKLSAVGTEKYTPTPLPPQTSFTITTPQLSAAGAEKYTPTPVPPKTNFTITTPPLSAKGTPKP